MDAVTGPLTWLQLTLSEFGDGTPSSIAKPWRGIVLSGGVIIWSGPALTSGGWLLACTVIVTVSATSNSPSPTVSRSTYTPGTLKEAVVEGASAFSKVTGPGPLATLHRNVRVLPTGRPSSVTVADRVTVFGSVTSWSSPETTTGAWLRATTVIVVSSLLVSSESEAVRRRA